MRNKRKRAAAFAMAALLVLCSGGCGPQGQSSQPAASSQAESSQEAASSSAASEAEEAPLTPAEKTRQEAEIVIEGHMQKNLTYKPLVDPEDQYNLNIVKNIHMIGMVTGEYSINQTKTNYGVGGTDLGVMINKGDETFVFFGDTFKNENMADNWRSNVAAVTTDTDYTDGILFDRMIVTGTGVAKELLRGKKIDNDEMTKIPTGGICIDDTLYLSFMSVRHWGEAGYWDCNYGGVAKSTDNGETWEILENLQWPGDSEFCQMYPVIVDDMVYVPGISGGRDGVARMMRVPVSQYEDFNAYEYLTEVKEDGTPVFQKGPEGLENAVAILQKPVGEMSFLYSEYLEEWLVTYISGSDIIMRSAKNIWGPYSKAVTIAAQSDFPGLYGAFMNPKYVSEDGKKIAFLMSIWSPVYNVAVMEMELER